MGTVPDSFANGVGPDDQVAGIMDKCRISWGKILHRDEKANLVVQYEPIQRQNGKLSLGHTIETKVMSEIGGDSFIRDAKAGDWISFHWGLACTKLTLRQVANLKKYTLLDMDVANAVPIPQ
jgi:hypothetical protein